MSALDVLRQIKETRRAKGAPKRAVQWGNAEYINETGPENLSRRELRNHLEARDLDTGGTRLELIERLRVSLADEQLHKYAYTETLDTEAKILAELEERGSVYVVGSNEKGELGVGDTFPRLYFTLIPQLRGLNVVSVSAGVDLVYAVTADHDVYVWGGGGVGRTGLNPNSKLNRNKLKNRINFMEPMLVHDLSGEEITEVSVGLSHGMACATAGDCFVWGDSVSGQLGLGDLLNRNTVSINNSFPAVVSVAAGANHSVVLTKTQDVYVWGHAANGRLGLGATERIGVKESERFFFPVPYRLPSLEPISQLTCGADHTLALGSSGLWAWGSGAGGKLGLGDQKDRLDPCLIPRLRGKSVLTISASSWYSMAVVMYPPMRGGGLLYTWGSGYHGQLAQGTLNIVLCPEVVQYFLGVHMLIKKISAGIFHAAAITIEGELYTWGSNRNMCLGRTIDEKDVEFTPIPGHCGGFGAFVKGVGRGLARDVACGKDFTVMCTEPYKGPVIEVAAKLMEEAKIRAVEALEVAQAAAEAESEVERSRGS